MIACLGQASQAKWQASQPEKGIGRRRAPFRLCIAGECLHWTAGEGFVAAAEQRGLLHRKLDAKLAIAGIRIATIFS